MDIHKFEEAYLSAGGKSSELEKEDGEYTSSKAQMAWEMWKTAKVKIVPEGFVLVPKEPNDKITFSVLDDIFSCSFCYDDPSSWKMAYKKLIDGVSKTVIEAQEQNG